jgi:ferredoxin-thioredoxin reductase catalytic chain
MNAAEVMAAWADFAAPNDFRLNPDREHVATVLEGVLASQQVCGLRLCPCRLRDGSRERDLELLCPCNFKRHDTWRGEGRCWCGLFVKKE